MADIKTQSDFGERGVAEMMSLLQQLLPMLERLLPMVQTFCDSESARLPSLPCVSSTVTDCPEVDEPLAASVNGLYEGRLHGEITGGLDFDAIRAQRGSPEGVDGDEKARKDDHGALRHIRTVEPFDALESYKSCWDLLTQKQKEVIRLHHGEGKGVKEIAQVLHRSVSTVSGLLTRARKTKADHDAIMRKEAFTLHRQAKANFNEI